MKKFSLVLIDEILRRSVGEPEDSLAAEFGFSPAQLMAWRGQYGQRLSPKGSSAPSRRIIDTRSYHVVMSLSPEDTKRVREKTESAVIRGKDGVVWSISTGRPQTRESKT